MTRGLLLALALGGTAWAQAFSEQEYVRSGYIRQVEAQPGGDALVYTVTCETPAEPRFDRRGVQARNDVWIFEEGKSRVLLDDAFHPLWSPDGKAVAVLDAEDEDARLKVWWQKNGRWSVLRHARIGAGPGSGYAWLPDGRLLVSTLLELPQNKDPLILEGEGLKLQARNALVEWNPDSGTTREWGRGVISSFSLDPTGKRAALIGWNQWPESPRVGDAGRRLALLHRDETRHELGEIQEPRAASLEWRKDGQQLLVQDGRRQWWLVDAIAGKARKLPESVQEACFLGEKLLIKSGSWAFEEGESILPGSARVFSGASGGCLALDGDKVYSLDLKGKTVSVRQLPGEGPVEVESSSLPLVVKRGQKRFGVRTEGQIQSLPEGGKLAVGANRIWSSNPERSQLLDEEGRQGPGLPSLSNPGHRLVKLPDFQGQREWLLLPSAGDGPFPTVVWLQQSLDSLPPQALLSNSGGAYNAHLLAAQGYAVYFPGLSSGELAGIRQSLARATSLPQVDRQRLALFGHGDWADRALLVADASSPVRAVVAVQPGMTSGVPGGRLGLASSGWQEALLNFHDRNAAAEIPLSHLPLTRASQIQRPSLLLAGHESQAQEALFGALYRQGQGVRLVRYSHRLNPLAPQVLHQWHQIHHWLARHLSSEPR